MISSIDFTERVSLRIVLIAQVKGSKVGERLRIFNLGEIAALATLAAHLGFSGAESPKPLSYMLVAENAYV